MINRDSATMHSTRTGNSDDVHADYCMTSSTQATWGSPPQGVPTTIDTSECAGPGNSFSRCSPRKQSLYQLLVEFEKCAQLSEDFLVVRMVWFDELFYDSDLPFCEKSQNYHEN